MRKLFHQDEIPLKLGDVVHSAPLGEGLVKAVSLVNGHVWVKWANPGWGNWYLPTQFDMEATPPELKG